MGFISRSLLLLFALYGLVFAVGDAYLLHGGAPIWVGIALGKPPLDDVLTTTFFAPLVAYVFQDTFHTTKLLSEVRD